MKSLKHLVFAILMVSLLFLAVSCGGGEAESSEAADPSASETASTASTASVESEAVPAEPSGKAKEAMELLKQYSKEELGLPAELSEYELIPDDMLMNIQGAECIGINVFADLGERRENISVFYVSTDLTTVYAFNDAAGNYRALPAPGEGGEAASEPAPEDGSEAVSDAASEEASA